ncbi:hypothetical protein BC828DRAFT_392056 [Blastocladiella britannica]|nr:hypothetical protein BC828DRAFT_392056 [Blastocladiella britannica]
MTKPAKSRSRGESLMAGAQMPPHSATIRLFLLHHAQRALFDAVRHNDHSLIESLLKAAAAAVAGAGINASPLSAPLPAATSLSGRSGGGAAGTVLRDSSRLLSSTGTPMATLTVPPGGRYSSCADPLASFPADPDFVARDARATALHLAASLGHSRALLALLFGSTERKTAHLLDDNTALPRALRSNPNAHDVESGWTPLHRALYLGHLQIAAALLSHPRTLTTECDHEGNTAFELLRHTLPPAPLQLPDDMFTWGSNVNYVLGHSGSGVAAGSRGTPLAATGEPRGTPRPKRVSFRPHDAPTFEFSAASRVPTITAASVAKMHAVLATDDGIYVWGYGSAGRLGFSSVENPDATYGADADSDDEVSLSTTAAAVVVRPVRATFLPNDGRGALSVAAGRDHSAVVVPSGGVWVWGCNQFGQCGFALSHADEVNLLSYPKAVPPPAAEHVIEPVLLALGALRREPMTGVACSNVHTVAWSSTCVVTFGLNLGQLGHPRDPRTGSTSATVQPRKVSSLPPSNSVTIAQCVAADRATAVLLNDGDVVVLQDHAAKQLKLSGPSRPLTYLEAKGGWEQTKSHSGSSIRHLAAADAGTDTSYFAAVTSEGDILAWSLAGSAIVAAGKVGASSDAPPRSRFSRVGPRVVWDHYATNNTNASQVAVGANGALVACTEDGHLYQAPELDPSISSPRFLQWSRIPLDRVTGVFANAHGSFAALRSNLRVEITNQPPCDGPEARREWLRPERGSEELLQAVRSIEQVQLVAAGGESVAVPGRILAPFDFFQTALAGHWHDASLADPANPSIALPDFHAATIRSFVSWARGPRKDVAPHTFADLLLILRLANFLLVDDLAAQTAAALAQCLTSRTALELVVAATDARATELKRVAVRFILEDLEPLMMRHVRGPAADDPARTQLWCRALEIVERECKALQDQFAPLAVGSRTVGRAKGAGRFAVTNFLRPVDVGFVWPAISSDSTASEMADGDASPTLTTSTTTKLAPAQLVLGSMSPAPRSVAVAASDIDPDSAKLPESPAQRPYMQLPAAAPPKPLSLAEIQAQEEERKRRLLLAKASRGTVPRNTRIESQPAADTATVAVLTLAAQSFSKRLVQPSQKVRKRQAAAAATTAAALPPVSAAPPAVWGKVATPASRGAPPASPPKLGLGPVPSAATIPSSSASPAVAMPPPGLVPAPSSSFLVVQQEQERRAKLAGKQTRQKTLAEIQIEEAAVATLLVRMRARRGPSVISGEMLSVCAIRPQ